MTSKHFARSLKSQFARMARDERGAEMVESVLVIGLITVISLMAMSVFGQTLANKWNDVMDALSSTST